MSDLSLLEGLGQMEKKIVLFAFVLMMVMVCNSVVFALSLMGPPKALLGQDHWDIGIEYTHQTMDLDAIGKVTETMPEFDSVISRKDKHNIDDLKSNVIMIKAGYGINDNWETFVRLGLADVKGDLEHIFPDNAVPDDYRGFNGNFGFGWGFGTRATFWQEDEISWGGLFQITWLEPDDSSIGLLGDPGFTGYAEIDIREVQIAVGPTWQVDDNIRIYGGPFFHLVDGDFDINGRTVLEGTEIIMKTSGDVEEESQFGGYVGTNLDVNEDTSCFIECQLTGDAWGIGIGIAWRF